MWTFDRTHFTTVSLEIKLVKQKSNIQYSFLEGVRGGILWLQRTSPRHIPSFLQHRYLSQECRTPSRQAFRNARMEG